MPSTEPTNTARSEPFFSASDLLDAALAIKWLIAGVLVLSLAAGMAILLFFPFSRQATVTIIPLSEFDTYEYRDENLQKLLAIDSTLLQSLFIDIIRRGNLVRNVMLDNKVIARNADESEDEFALRLDRLVDRIMLTPPAPETIRAGNRNWTLRYETRWPDVGYRLLREVVVRADLAVKERVSARYETAERDYIRLRSLRETDLRLKRRNVVADYDRMIDSRLAVLDEQIALLKSTGARQGRLLSQSEQQPSGQQIAVVDANKLAYLPGYEQLERNAELIRRRTNKELFVEGLLQIDQEIRTIEQDQTATRARAAYERALVDNKDFRAVNTDLTRASFRSSPLTLLALAGALAFGGLIVIFLVVIRTYRTASSRSA